MACDQNSTITTEKLNNLNTNANVFNEVVTSDQDKTPTQASDGEQKKTLTGLNQDVDDAINRLGGVDKGNYEDDPLIEILGEYVVYQRGISPTYWKIKDGVSLPYQIDSATYPDPSTDPSLQQYNDVNSLTLTNYTDIVYKESAGNSAVDNMINGNPIDSVDGGICSTGGTHYKISNTSGGIPLNNGLFAEAISTVFPKDFGAVGNGTDNDTGAFDLIEQYGGTQTVNLGGKTYLVDSIPATDKYTNGEFRVGSIDTPQYGLRYDGKTELAGLTPERVNQNTIRIFPGYCSDGAAVPTDTMIVNTPFDIDLTTTGLNGLDVGTPAVGENYYIYIIKSSSTGQVGAVASLEISTSLVTKPAGFDLIRKLPIGLPYIAQHGVNPEGIPAFHLEGWPLCTVKFTNMDDGDSVWKVLDEGTQDTLSTVDCSRLIPDNARMVLFHCETKSFAQSGNSALRSAGTGGTGKPVGYARQDFDYVDVGAYNNTRILNNDSQITYLDNGTSNTYWRGAPGISYPYTCDATTYPNPADDPNLIQVDEDGDISYGEFWMRVTSARAISYRTTRGTKLTLRIAGYSMTERS